MQTDFGLMLVRLCFSGPLLYIGLSMALHPDSFIAGLSNLMRGIRNFEQQIRAPRWQAPLLSTDSIVVSSRMRAAFRMAGTALAVTAVLHLAGILT
jgi:hypothetical protein